MARLPVRETYDCGPALVGSYISDRQAILHELALSEAEPDLKKAWRKTRLNELRNRYVKDFGLFTPGVDFILSLLEESKSAREFLRSFDAAREHTEIDKKLAHRGGRLEHRGREMANDLALAPA